MAKAKQPKLKLHDTPLSYTIHISIKAAATLSRLHAMFPFSTRTRLLTHAAEQGLEILARANSETPPPA